MFMKDTSEVRKIAFTGDHRPRKCGIATFTSDLPAAVANAYLPEPVFRGRPRVGVLAETEQEVLCASI